MGHLKKITCFLMLLQAVTQNVVSDYVTNANAENVQSPDVNGRRSGGIIILDNPGKPDGHMTSHKVETQTYTKHITSGNGGSGFQGWVSGAQTGGNIVLRPQIQGIVQSQETCGQKNKIVAHTGGQSSTLHRELGVESSQTFNANGSINSLSPNANQWQSGQKEVNVASLVVGQDDGQTLLNGHSQVSTNNFNNIRVLGETITSGNQGINTIEETDNVETHKSFFYPDHYSHKVSIVTSEDGIYANDVTGQQNQNIMVSDSNSQNIIAVPVMSPHLGRPVVHGYRPNIQHYLQQIETSKIIKNPKAVMRVPAFIQHIKPGQLNVVLSDDQLNSYRQYLIQSGLIKLKPYQLIFSEQFKPKLKTLQWMVVSLETNAEFCKQRCGTLFPKNTLYSTLIENAHNLPIKLLVPVLKIRNGLTKNVSGFQVSEIPVAIQLKHSSSNGGSTNQN